MSVTLRSASLTLLALSLVGCIAGGEGQGGQAVALVNDREITVHELNFEAAHRGEDPNISRDGPRRLAEALVERALLVEQAQAQELERDPQVLQALRAAREQVLAQSYLERVLAQLTEPSKQEIADYYTDHPELFAERRIYHFRELVAESTPDVRPLAESLTAFDDLAAVAQWLRARDLPFATRETLAPAEEIAFDVLKVLHGVEPSQLARVPPATNLHVIELISAQDQSVELDAAQPRIREYLLGRAREQAAAAELARLRAKASIEWRGAFAGASPDQPYVSSPDQAEYVSVGAEGLK